MRTIEILRTMSLLAVFVLMTSAAAQAQTWFTKTEAIPVLQTKISTLQTQLNNAAANGPEVYWLRGSISFYSLLLDQVSNQNIALSSGLLAKNSQKEYFTISGKDYLPLTPAQRKSLVTEGTLLLRH